VIDAAVQEMHGAMLRIGSPTRTSAGADVSSSRAGAVRAFRSDS
jgi:hypothetical protein